MPLFGGSSSRTTTEIDERNFTNVDNRVGGDRSVFGGNQSVQAGDYSNINLTTTDFGAIDAATNITDSAIEFSRDALSASINSSQAAVDDAITLAQSVSVDQAARTTQMLIVGGVIAAVFLIYVSFKK